MQTERELLATRKEREKKRMDRYKRDIGGERLDTYKRDIGGDNR